MARPHRTIWGNPFSALGPGTSRAEALIAYIAREHRRGRRVRDILDDPYVVERTTRRQRELLLEEPLLIRTLIRATWTPTSAAFPDEPPHAA